MGANKRQWEREKLEFENSLVLRNFEIDNFWKRGWFFGALLLALIAGYFQVRSSDTVNATYCVYIAFIALLVSLAQSLMNRGSKYWQERYEYVTKNRESILGIDVTKTRKYHSGNKYYEKSYIDMCIRAKGENPFLRSIRFSVSKITIILWDVIVIFCFFLWIEAINVYYNDIISDVNLLFYMILFHLTIFYYVLLVSSFHGKIVERLLGKKYSQPQRHNVYYDASEDYVEYKERKLNSPTLTK